jgi:hypothetical protein
MQRQSTASQKVFYLTAPTWPDLERAVKRAQYEYQGVVRSVSHHAIYIGANLTWTAIVVLEKSDREEGEPAS